MDQPSFALASLITFINTAALAGFRERLAPPCVTMVLDPRDDRPETLELH